MLLQITMMNNHTFIIPAYKESPFLEDCINSLLNQSLESTILITTSTPNTYIKNLAEKYKIAYYINETKQKSIAADWNFALSKATTGFATIAHQDDIYNIDYTKNVLAALTNYKHKALIAFTNYHDFVNKKPRKLTLNALVKSILRFPFLFKSNITSNFLKKALLAFGDPIGCPTVTFDLKNLQSFSFSDKYDCILDWVAWYELACKEGSFLYINKSLMLHRIHEGSETSNLIKSGKRKQEEAELFTQIWGKFVAKIFIELYALGHKQNKV